MYLVKKQANKFCFEECQQQQWFLQPPVSHNPQIIPTILFPFMLLYGKLTPAFVKGLLYARDCMFSSTFVSR
jgi:hypothetical protein